MQVELIRHETAEQEICLCNTENYLSKNTKRELFHFLKS